MKFYKVIFILVVFFKTETLFSKNNLFSVNNIEIKRTEKITNEIIADKAIKKGFSQLINKILLKEDIKKISDLNFSTIKGLVAYYQISNTLNNQNKDEILNFNVTFDKVKIHNLFYKLGVSYSEISDRELYILPILYKNNEIFIFNKNFFYNNWSKIYDEDLIEFILPIDNIEIIKNINFNKNNLIEINIEELFTEYPNKNLVLVILEENQNTIRSIYIKAKIEGKNISKNLNLKEKNLSKTKLYEKIIIDTKKEIINLVKSRNLIDIRTPSFLNIRLELNKKNNLVELNKRLKKIDLIENIYVEEFNKDYMYLKIKYLGKLDKIVNQLKRQDIKLQLINDQWVITTL